MRLNRLLLGNVDRSLTIEANMPCLLFSLKNNGLILVDPALILDLAFDHVVSMDRPDDRTYTAHVKEKVAANKVIAETPNLVAHRNGHILLRSDMGLIGRNLKDITLIEVNLLVFLGFAEEELRLLAKFHDDHDSRLVLLGGLSGPLDKLLARLKTVVFENAHAVHPIPDHHVDKFLVRALIQSAQNTGVTLLDEKDGRLEVGLGFITTFLSQLLLLIWLCC